MEETNKAPTALEISSYGRQTPMYSHLGAESLAKDTLSTTKVRIRGVLIEGYRNGLLYHIGSIKPFYDTYKEFPLKTVVLAFPALAMETALKEVKEGIPYVKSDKHRYVYHRNFERWFKDLKPKEFDIYFEDYLCT